MEQRAGSRGAGADRRGQRHGAGATHTGTLGAASSSAALASDSHPPALCTRGVCACPVHAGSCWGVLGACLSEHTLPPRACCVLRASLLQARRTVLLRALRTSRGASFPALSLPGILPLDRRPGPLQGARGLHCPCVGCFAIHGYIIPSAAPGCAAFDLTLSSPTAVPPRR